MSEEALDLPRWAGKLSVCRTCRYGDEENRTCCITEDPPMLIRRTQICSAWFPNSADLHTRAEIIKLMAKAYEDGVTEVCENPWAWDFVSIR